MADQECFCTVNLRTHTRVNRDSGCPRHGGIAGFYVVNVNKGSVVGPFTEDTARDSIEMDLAEWATRSREYAHLRHSQLITVTVRDTETVITEASLDRGGWSGSRPRAQARINHDAGRISVDTLNHHYQVAAVQACLEVASELITRQARSGRDQGGIDARP